MVKKLRVIFSLILCLSLLASFAVPALAVEIEETVPVEEPAEEPVIIRKQTICTEEQFLSFAEDCRMDRYSRNLEVTLLADLDLRGMGFEGVPIFCGTFNGNYHTIRVDIGAEGSNVGLFRYLTDTALVRALNVEGSVQPQGSRSNVGGIAGCNAGTIRTSSFTGNLSGVDNVGGIVGINELTGIVENCTVSGSIHGSHFVGGLAGENRGVIRACENSAQINTTAVENTVELSDITMDSLTGSESANTVTDIGGIAGTSTGVIRACTNEGKVGYRQMGYNIGGIAGSQTGYIVDCVNRGEINGRKEVGGIAGQMEPVTRVKYDRDTLQILQEQVDEMGTIAGKTASSAQGSVGALNSQMSALEGQAKDAADAIGMLLPEDLENPEMPDDDTLLAAQNALSGSLSGMTNSMQSMIATTESAVGSLNSNLNALSNQINAISETVSGASENLGGSITDVSDADTEGELTCKVENCRNYGNVLADLNVGGIAGAMAPENDLDPEDDLHFSGELSLNFEGELRSVILSCESRATVTVKKQSGGGIVGRAAMGLVKDCVSTGTVEGESADYVGGIAGESGGFIRGCGANMMLFGKTCLGGIAGSGTVVSDCHSMVTLGGGAEKLGAILGITEQTDTSDPVANNFYLSMDADPGAIDGISYAGKAEPMNQAAFMALEGLSDIFRTVNVYFVFEDGTVKTIPLAAGSSLDASQIPAIPEKAGYISAWEGLEAGSVEDVYFDLTFTAVYTSLAQTIQSGEQRHNGKPLLLAQGAFEPEQTLTVVKTDAQPELAGEQSLLESWEFSVSDGGAVQKLRYTVPEACNTEEAVLFVRNAAGQWYQTEFAVTDSCVVFDVAADDNAFCLVHSPADHSWIYWAVGGGAVLLAAVVVATIVVRSRKKRK